MLVSVAYKSLQKYIFVCYINFVVNVSLKKEEEKDAFHFEHHIKKEEEKDAFHFEHHICVQTSDTLIYSHTVRV